MAAAPVLNTNAKIFFSRIDWKIPNTPQIAIKPKIIINKFMTTDTPFENDSNNKVLF